MEEEKLWKFQVLNERRPDLCRCLTPKNHYPYLRSKYVLSRDDEELIEAEISTKQKTHLLIDILSKKVPKGFDELVKSLIQDKTQIHLAEMLNIEYEQKKRNNQENQTPHSPAAYRHSGTISDLGVDTDKLPKPQMPRRLVKTNDKDHDRKCEANKDIIFELQPSSKLDS